MRSTKDVFSLLAFLDTRDCSPVSSSTLVVATQMPCCCCRYLWLLL